jgi:hypothetical protein
VTLGDRQVRWIFLEDRRHRVRSRLAVERAAARQDLIQHGAEREDVGAMIRGQPAHLFGRHVPERAKHQSVLRLHGSCGQVARHRNPSVGLR